MAPKKPNHMEDPPTASSTEDEEAGEEGEEVDQESSSEDSTEDEEEEEEESSRPKLSSPPPARQQPPAKKSETLTASTTTAAAPRPEASGGSDSSSDESETDSDDESRHKKVAVKPMASKPMDGKETTLKTTTKPRSKVLSSPAKKRAAANENNDNKNEPKDSKKAKRSGSDLEEEPKAEDTKKQLFQRLFSEDDEIAVLKGFLDYSTKKGADPSSDLDGFFDFIKNSLQCDVTKAQVNDKIRRLKKKYMNNVNRAGKKGEEPSFSRPHDQKSFELSKKIWAAGGETPIVEASANKKRKNQQQQAPKVNGKAVQKIDFVASEGEKMEVDGHRAELQGANDLFLMNRNVEEFVIKHGLELVDGKKRVELEERWSKLRVAQLELFVERTQLTLEQAKLMLEAAKSSNH